MFEKMKLKGEVKRLRQLITDLEGKRSRSQSALVAAILEQKEPNEKDVEYFNSFTKQIDEARELMRKKEEELAGK